MSSLLFVFQLVIGGSSISIIGSIWTACALIALEWGKDSKSDQKDDLFLLTFLSVITIIASIIINLFWQQIELNRLIIGCSITPVFTFFAYWSGKRFLKNKAKK